MNINDISKEDVQKEIEWCSNNGILVVDKWEHPLDVISYEYINGAFEEYSYCFHRIYGYIKTEQITIDDEIVHVHPVIDGDGDPLWATTCLCCAYSSSECICGSWDIEDSVFDHMDSYNAKVYKE